MMALPPADYPAATWLAAHPDNFTVGRAGHAPVALVNHVQQGSMGGTVQAFTHAGWQASAHYAVGLTGRVYQFVRDADTAYSNGFLRLPNPQIALVATWLAHYQQPGWNPNGFTLSLEWEGKHTGGDWGALPAAPPGVRADDHWRKGELTGFRPAPARAPTWWQPTPPQWAAGVALVRHLCAAHHIPPDRAHVHAHGDYDSVGKWWCPGKGFPLDKLLAEIATKG